MTGDSVRGRPRARLSAEGRIVIYSSHELEMVERVCSEVLILREGRVAAHAATAALREQVHAASLEDAFRTLVFTTDTNETFYMRNTPMPLSIAWFDASGRFISATDMAPCADRPDCPTYAAARAYRYALEVQRGGLSSLGIGPGSTITVGAAC